MHLQPVALLLGLAAGRVRGCVFEQNIDFTGNDLKPGGDVGGMGLNATACCAVCYASAGCTFWTLQPPYCYLKNSSAGRRTYAGATSGSTKGPSPPPGPPGPPLPPPPPPPPTPPPSPLEGLDCQIHQLALKFAQEIQPERDLSTVALGLQVCQRYVCVCLHTCASVCLRHRRQWASPGWRASGLTFFSPQPSHNPQK
jgi:hypothetical protein